MYIFHTEIGKHVFQIAIAHIKITENCIHDEHKLAHWQADNMLPGLL